MRRITMLAVCTLALVLCAGPAFAQLTDVLKVDYFSNANTSGAPDGTLRVSNPGTAGGNVIALFFVFDPEQEMSECCACNQTPDDLQTMSVNADLTSNPLTGVPLTTGAIKILSVGPVLTGTAASTAKAKGTAVAIRNTVYGIEPSVRAWTTHIQNSNFAETETASQDATLSTAEVIRLGVECTSILVVGSGHGICSCGSPAEPEILQPIIE
ncbi:MAG TPA: hypothetical protein VMB49_16340 [Acidobacteriaceae bacterium]|nr:hypothetical protein [Acidobacteriaceae bacterium]HUO27110.1 hypothetical protein [Candidatus Aquilonibacter sp.]